MGDDGDLELDGGEDIEEGFRAFVDCKGDRFRNSADLAMHVEERGSTAPLRSRRLGGTHGAEKHRF